MSDSDPTVTDILQEARVVPDGTSSNRLMALLICEIRLLREATAGLRWAVENEIDYQNERRRDRR